MLDHLGGSWLRCYMDPRIDSSHLLFLALHWTEVEECRVLDQMPKWILAMCHTVDCMS